MADGWPRTAILLMGVLAPSLVQAQGWVDPPAAAAPAPTAPAPTPPAPETPPTAPPPATPPRNVEIQPQAAPPAPPPAAQPAPTPAPPPTQQARPAPPPREPAPREAPPREPDVATRPEPEPRRQAEPARPPAPRPAPREPAVAERPAPEQPAANLGRAAQRLTLAYLDYWSASNVQTMEAMPDFYAPRVEFHGRAMSARALFEEKRRFARRWPDRTYSPRADTMRISCAPAGEVCTVRTLFDFVAANPASGRQSAGTGHLELVVALAGPTPVIVAESSQVMRRGRLAPTEADEED